LFCDEDKIGVLWTIEILSQMNMFLPMQIKFGANGWLCRFKQKREEVPFMKRNFISFEWRCAPGAFVTLSGRVFQRRLYNLIPCV